MAALLTVGCYNYQPVALTPQTQSGTFLVATLTDSGARALAAYLGPEAQAVQGRTVSFDDAGLRLSVTAVETNRGDELSWKGETVTLPRPFIASTQTRRLAKGRTIMLVGLSVAALVGTAVGFKLLGNSDSPTQGGGGGPNPH